MAMSAVNRDSVRRVVKCYLHRAQLAVLSLFRHRASALR
jgi:hypothetical protein